MKNMYKVIPEPKVYHGSLYKPLPGISNQIIKLKLGTVPNNQHEKYSDAIFIQDSNRNIFPVYMYCGEYRVGTFTKKFVDDPTKKWHVAADKFISYLTA